MSKKDTKTVTTTERVQMMQSERPAPEGSCGTKKSNLITHDEIVGHDYQGWPLYQLRVISLLRVLGVSEDTIKQIPNNILTTQMSELTDDGTGYGVNEQKITNCSIDKEHGIVYLWV